MSFRGLAKLVALTSLFAGLAPVASCQKPRAGGDTAAVSRALVVDGFLQSAPDNFRPFGVGSAAGVELGVRFKAKAGTNGGTIRGIRTYRENSGGGGRVSLWSETGQLLAQATKTPRACCFRGPEEIQFSSPVAIEEGKVYTASILINGSFGYDPDTVRLGQYSSYLQPVEPGGVYVYGADGGFPTETVGYNYWVDPVFLPSGCVSPPPGTPATVNLFGNQAPTNNNFTGGSGVTLGVKFKSYGNHKATGLRFFKTSGNDGTHVGNLWDAAGNLLASATFTNETASGWQTVSFGSPVQLNFGDTYIATYYSPTGHYAWTPGGLSSGQGTNTDPVYVPANASLTGGNTAFHFGPSSEFPSTASTDGANLFVDVTIEWSSCTPSSPPPAGSNNIFGDVTPAVTAAGGGGAVELGVKFRTNGTRSVTGIRFYKGAANTGTHVGSLWDASGHLLASATFAGETATGWQTVSFSAPVPVTAGQTYVASYLSPNGYFAYEAGGLAAGKGAGTDPVYALTDAAAGGNGAYVYGGGFPSESGGGANYFVDVVVATDGGSTPPPSSSNTNLFGDVTPAVTAAGGGGAVELGVKFKTTGTQSVTGIRFYKGASNTGTHVGSLWNASGNLLARATFVGESGTGWQTVSFSAPVAVTAEQTYVASYLSPSGYFAYQAGGLASGKGTSSDAVYAPPAASVGGNGVYVYGGGFPSEDGGGNYYVDVVVSSGGGTPPPPPSGGSNIFGDVTPAVTAAGGGAEVELGVKFRTSGTRSVTGIRFYKGASNTGTHVGSLWNASGQLLARATFASETASGWQTVSFSAPVAVAAGQTYIASYLSPNGYFAYQAGGLASGRGTSSDAVYAPAAASVGGNGVYVYGGGFPSEDGGGNYYVDVVVSADGGTPPPPPPSGGSNIFGDVTPAVTAAGGGAEVELGVKFKTSGTQSVTGIRFYKGAANTGTHVGSLWNASGQLLARATFAGETASGWQTVSFSSPVAVTAGQTYIASYLSPNGYFAYQAGGLASGKGTSSDAVYAPAAASVGGNGVYVYGGGFPSEDGGGNYYVDVVVSADGGTPPPPPPSGGSNIFSDVTPAVTAAGGGAEVELGVKFKTSGTRSVTGIRFYKGASNTGTHVGSLWDATGHLLARATFAGETASGWQTVSFSSPVAVTAGQTYIASYLSPNGYFAYQAGGLASGKGTSSDPVYVPPAASVGGNGVYVYGGGFPSEDGGGNYYVDVVVSSN